MDAIDVEQVLRVAGQLLDPVSEVIETNNALEVLLFKHELLYFQFLAYFWQVLVLQAYLRRILPERSPITLEALFPFC